MSLINQMFKDLEQRNAIPAQPDSSRPNKNLYAKFSAHSFKPKYWTLTLSVMGIALLAGGAYWWTQLAQQPPANDSSKLMQLTPVIVQASPMQSATAITLAPPLDLPASSTANITTIVADTTSMDKLAQPQPLADKAEPLKPSASAKASVRTDVSLAPIAASEVATAKPSRPTNEYHQLISKHISPDQKSANLYRQALSNLQQGRVAEAQAALVEALEAKPSNHDARLTLASLLLDNNRHNDARDSLVAGLSIAPERADFRMALARLQIEAGDRTGALNSLEQGLTYAKDDADYLSFFATLLQGAERHEEAINYYLAALAANSAAASTSTTNALLGLGISLQATGKLSNAQEAFIRAQTDSTLSPELAVFVTQRLKQIKQDLTH